MDALQKGSAMKVYLPSFASDPYRTNTAVAGNTGKKKTGR